MFEGWWDALTNGSSTTTSGTGANATTTTTGGFSTSPLGTFMTAFGPVAVSGLANYYMNRNNQRQQNQNSEEERAFTGEQNALNRQAEMAMMEKKIQAEMAAAEMQAEAQKQATLQRAYQMAMEAALTSGQMRNQSLETFLAGVQGPYLRRPAA